MTYKAIIFDLDGTLLNTLDGIATCANIVLENGGYPKHNVDAYKYFVGEGVFALFRKALPENNRDEDTITALVKAFRHTYEKYGYEKVCLYEGIDELLNGLSERKIKMSILSNKPHELTRFSVSKFLSNWHFECVLGQRDNIPVKPDPSAAIEIINLLDLPSSDILYLGDTAVDMQTAVRAKLFPIGALWGFRDKKELEENGSKITVNTPREILRLID